MRNEVMIVGLHTLDDKPVVSVHRWSHTMKPYRTHYYRPGAASVDRLLRVIWEKIGSGKGTLIPARSGWVWC